MDEYAGRVLADRYRLPLPPSDEYELVETRAFDTYSGQEVLVRQVPLPEVVDAEMLDGGGLPSAARRTSGRTVRRSTDPAVRRAIEAAQAAAQVPDHPRLDQVFDVFAEAGSLWIVSELVAARPLAALLAERPLNPYRAAEIGSDVLTALRVLHAHGWTHRNITVRTVLICDDGRVVLTGLASGAAEEALCGYVPMPQPDDEDAYGPPAVESGPTTGPHVPPAASLPPAGPHESAGPFGSAEPGVSAGPVGLPAARGPAGELEAVRPQPDPDLPHAGSAAQLRAARAGAIAAYRAGTRAAARVNEEQRQAGTGEAAGAEETRILPAQRPGPPGSGRPQLTGGWGPTADDPYDDEGDDEDGGRGDASYGGEYGGRGDAPYGGEYGGPYGGESDDSDDDGTGGRRGQGAPGRRLHLTGTWGDGAGFGRPVPAGGSNEDALRADARRHGAAASEQLPQQAVSGRWDDIVAGGRAVPAYRGPATPLAAERARQARIAVVGAVTERWAPEQAGPVHENWQLAPPIGPATDLWALGALLYRAVQGHAPYPEEHAAELVQMVCGEPPAFAEECGPLRPVVESLLRQDPTERPDFEELRGWLRSLVRSAPEPEAGLDVVPLPSVDDTRLPVVRRRGELVRRRRSRLGSAPAHGRHRQTRERPDRFESARAERAPRLPREPKGPKALRTPPRPRPGSEGRTPRRLGRLLLALILLGMIAAITYAVLFMPKAGTGSDSQGKAPAATGSRTPGATDPDAPTGASSKPSQSPGAQKPQTSRSAVALAPGYTLRKDDEGFEVGVLKGWQRSPVGADRQIRYGSDGFSLLIVPGRDTVKANGGDPLAYQRDKERELQPFRDSSWSSATGLRRIDVGRQAMAEGQFTWQDDTGREVYVRNLAMIVDGRYHVLQVLGPDSERDKVTAIYEQAIASYRVTS
ncbi:protein kinase [Streptomyces sp. NPDC005318]|uniref:protein kinase n=1 Tax=Streptomyces sp. NPDC005318 TaxID=3157031 RepID=UPI0033A75F0F